MIVPAVRRVIQARNALGINSNERYRIMLITCLFHTCMCSVVLAVPAEPSCGWPETAGPNPPTAVQQPDRVDTLTDAELAKIDSDLKSPDWHIRRRALWRMAHAGCSADAVIDKYVAVAAPALQYPGDCAQTPISQVLQVLGKPAFPHSEVAGRGESRSTDTRRAP